MITSFEQLFGELTATGRERIVIAGGEDPEALKAAQESFAKGLGQAILVGRQDKIEQSLTALGFQDQSFVAEIVPVQEDAEKAFAAIEEVKKGGILLKGKINTADLMRAVLHKEKGLRTENFMSNVFAFEDRREGKTRLVLLSDGGVNIKPDLTAMVAIIKNAVSFAQKLGVEKPKVALLAAIEMVNPDMEETLQASIITKMNQRGQIPDCIIDGPLALDNAISEFAAEKKGIASPVAGNADILIVPNIACGNILGKSVMYYAGFPAGNLTVGAKVPIMIPSRADKSESKLNSIALSI
ncbi:MAG TPA: bifunctional enoyl-CoA hydratase/phosphate acetyltransferase, partial [Atribacterota bacterium]|nr:bifunctional enoyl-CoA hydratase/phosphate acetyltransferase [Atribacterota bacterium]